MTNSPPPEPRQWLQELSDALENEAYVRAIYTPKREGYIFSDEGKAIADTLIRIMKACEDEQIRQEAFKVFKKFISPYTVQTIDYFYKIFTEPDRDISLEENQFGHIPVDVIFSECAVSVLESIQRTIDRLPETAIEDWTAFNLSVRKHQRERIKNRLVRYTEVEDDYDRYHLHDDWPDTDEIEATGLYTPDMLQQQLTDVVERLLSGSTKLHRDFVGRHYLEERSPGQIAAEEGCSLQRVHQILVRALQNINRTTANLHGPHARDLMQELEETRDGTPTRF